jgi:hypothetical protein
VLADLLTASGDPRGEFITLQCRLAAAKDDEARRNIRIAENKLLAAHGVEWSKALLAAAPPTSPLRANKIAFHRGFLEEAVFPLSALDDVEPYFAAAPLLRRLRFDAPQWSGVPLAPPSLTGKLSSPRWRGVRALELRIPAGGDAAALDLAASENLSGLRELDLQASSWPVPDLTLYTGVSSTHLLTAAGARALASAPHLASLTHLRLAPNAIGSEGVKALVNAPWKLELLDVSTNQLDDVALLAIAESPQLGSLKSLVLGSGIFTPKGLEALAKSKALPSLETLEFDGSQLGPKGLAAFLSALRLPKLIALGLSATGLGDEGAKSIATSKSAAQLKSLELQDNKITQQGVTALADSTQLSGLERLLLNDAWLGKKANVEYLAGSTALAGCKIYVKGTLISRKAKKVAAAEKVTKKTTTTKKKKK